MGANSTGGEGKGSLIFLTIHYVMILQFKYL